jgi:EVE domain-containing protein
MQLDALTKSDRTYWVQIFTLETWDQFISAGANVTGFRSYRWGLIQKLKPGDWLLCYLSRVGQWIGILEVLSEPYLDLSPIWKNEVYPCRADVAVVTALNPQTAVPIRDLRERLSIFRTKNWGLYLISSPSKWNLSDAQVVIDAIEGASRNSLGSQY